MRKVILALGFLSILVYAIYYQKVFDYYSTAKFIYDFHNPLYLWGDITNCVIYLSIAVIYFFLGFNQEKKVRYLAYNAISIFWLSIVLTYGYNYAIDQLVVMHRVFTALFLTFLITVLCYFLSLLWYYFKK